jgi:predicted enzyme related to lactoylglutathione lyase
MTSQNSTAKIQGYLEGFMDGMVCCGMSREQKYQVEQQERLQKFIASYDFDAFDDTIKRQGSNVTVSTKSVSTVGVTR